MAITSLQRTQTGPTRFVFTYASDAVDPTFYIYINGELETETDETSYEVTSPLNTQFQFDVLDDEDALPEEFFPSTMILRWDGTPDSTQFRIEKYVVDTWVAKQVVIRDDRRVFHYNSELLDDSTVHTFQVVPVDEQGRDGVALEFEAEMCRYPDDPVVDISIDTGEFVIAA